MKNPNGLGSVYKLSGKRRRPYIARKTIGFDPINGNAIKMTIGYYETKREAIIALQEYIKNPDRIISVRMKFKEVHNLWRESHYKNISETTQKHYDKFYRLAISPYFDEMIFKDIKFVHIQMFLDDLSYAKSTIKLIKFILKSMWTFAIKNDFVDKNIAELAEIRNKPINVIKRRVFTKSEIEILWENKDIPFVDTVLILIYTGLRINELLKLKNKEIDLEKRCFITAGSKTDAGKNRLIPIHSKVLPLITKRMNIHNQFLIMKDNSKISYSSYQYYFKQVLEKLKMEIHTVHDTRHTFATLLSNSNANPVSITEMIGHKKYPTTAKIYTHKDLEELRKAVELI